MEIIAYYLPQYHPTPDNDRWWGKGFTEWTNVAKAKPLFRGHYQPKIPADLGFYDLRNDWVREEQAQLAHKAGVTGFCYYHYWFGNGKKELEIPFNKVLKSGKPDFPFCLCWANESWYRKFWNKDGEVIDSKFLIEQNYPGENDHINHFNHLLSAFKDDRYIKIDNKPIFVIYKPLTFPQVDDFIKLWNKLAIDNGFNGIFFIGFTYNVEKEGEEILKAGFNAVDSCRLNRNRIKNFGWFFRKLLSVVFHTPRKTSYKKYYPKLIGDIEKDHPKIFPTLIPNWDHTPRSGINGDLMTKSRPEYFKKHCLDVLRAISKKDKNSQICFLKSWNEWGEGNYMEPDLKYGHGYINALSEAISEINNNE